MKLQKRCSRRTFVGGVAGAGAMPLLQPAAGAFEDADPRVATIVASTLGIDTHNHIDVPLTAAEVPGPAIDLAGEMKRSGLSAICMTFVLDYQQLRNPGEAVVAAMLHAGFNAGEIGKVGGGNFCRIFDDATAVRH